MASYADGFAALLRGDAVSWAALSLDPARMLQLCGEQGLTGLIYQRARVLPPECGWPASVVDGLARAAHAETAAEMMRGRELREALGGLAEAGIRPILLKGTSLAYSVYEEPGLRPRGDTDVLVSEADVSTARRVLAALGYAATLHCDDLFSQFEVQKRDQLGVLHVLDVHWKISTQPTFERLLTYDELADESVAVGELGPHARTASPIHALLLACVHPAMHHQNVEHLLWIHDTHLLASRLSAEAFDTFVELASRKEMMEVCAQELQRARERFGTVVPAAALARLSGRAGNEASSVYLRRGRRWHHELASILSALPGWSARARHLRGVLFPHPRYVLGAYGLSQTPLGLLLLPALYLHRNVNGAWKILLGRK